MGVEGRIHAGLVVAALGIQDGRKPRVVVVVDGDDLGVGRGGFDQALVDRGAVEPGVPDDPDFGLGGADGGQEVAP